MAKQHAGKPIGRRSVLQAFGAGTAAAAVSGALHAAQADKPNIIFIIVDDMGYADLGCYGGKVIRTPNIDRMAAEGMQFTQAYSGCVVCAPARSTLMTGYHMGHTSVRGNTGGISLTDQDVTVAQVLGQAGYVCGGFGKWGLGDLDTPGVPEKKGFDLFYGYYHQIHAHSYYPDYLIRNGRKEPLPGNKGFRGRKNKRAAGVVPTVDRKTGRKRQFSHYLIFEEMLKFIRANKDRPMFCYAPWTPPHGNYHMPAEDPAWRLYKDGKLSAEAKVVAAMDSMIDRHVGQVLALLKELGLDEKTIVFFCSDNGAAQRFDGELDSSGPLRGRKRTMYEGGILTPMIVRWPGRIKAGAVSDLPWYFCDVMPTLAGLAGATQHLPKDIDGLSVAPTLVGQGPAGGKQKSHEQMYWEFPAYRWSRKTYEAKDLMQALRVGDWKILRHRTDEPWQLYDLSRDVGEKHDLAASHPDVVKKLAAQAGKARAKPIPQIEPSAPKGKCFR